jgi:hypothetical protein
LLRGADVDAEDFGYLGPFGTGTGANLECRARRHGIVATALDNTHMQKGIAGPIGKLDEVMSFARAKSNRTSIVDRTRTSLTRGYLCWRDRSRLSLEPIAAPTVRATPVTFRQERCTKNIPRLTACDIWLGVDRQQ